MILAAGLGTRLRPLTAARAKPVVPFLGRPLLDYTLDWLRRAGLRSAVINLHHCPESVRERYGDGSRGLRLRYSLEERLLGTAGGPRKVLDRLDSPVLLVNGDVVTGVPLGPLVAAHEASGALATLVLHDGPAADRHPPVCVDADGRVRGFGDAGSAAGGKPAGCFTGIHLVDRRVLEVVPAGVPCGIVEPVYRHLLEDGLPLAAVTLPGPWYEVGTPAAYRGAQLEALAREDFPLAFAGHRRVGSGCYTTPSTRLDRAAVRPPYLLGRGVHVADGADLEAVVAGPRVRIGEGATIRRSVLLAGALVGPGARLEDAVVLEDAHVPAGGAVTGVWAGDAGR